MIILRKIRKVCTFKDSSDFVNRMFTFVDGFLSLFCVAILFLSDDRSSCLASFYLFYSLFFIGQAISHYLLIKLRYIDVVKFDKTIKRLIGIICFVEILYLFLVVVFWQKSNIHPLYCAACQQFGYPFIIGILFIVHFILSGGILISLIYLFVSRKYYLIALGGFQVEQRIVLERQEALRRVGLIQPNYAYPIQSSIKSNKYYKFQDVNEPSILSEDICSICLNKKLDTENIIKTKCNHFYHRSCVEKWATVNSRCPDCRTQFELDFTQRKLIQIESKTQQNSSNKKLDVISEISHEDQARQEE